jgi:hypothetical protein
MLNKPLNPSIRLDPLIMNKKHKQINTIEKILEDANKLFKKVNPVFST